MNVTLRSRTLFYLSISTLALTLGPLATPTNAQITRAPGPSKVVLGGMSGGVVRGSAVADDTVHGVKLVVAAHGDVHGAFTDANGTAISAPFQIWPGASGFGQFPSVTFSPHLGGGAFLVTWNASSATPPYVNTAYGRVVSYTQAGYLASAIFPLSDTTTFAEVGAAPAVAYSPATQSFLVTWQSAPPLYSIRGRMLSVASLSAGAVFEVSTGNAQYPSVAFNGSTGQFGVGYSGFGGSGATTTFAIVAAGGGVVSRNTFNVAAGKFITDVAVNPTTRHCHCHCHCKPVPECSLLRLEAREAATIA
jgi:hypothetical protein